MASDIFRNIIEQKIDVFASTFGNDANKLFKKDSKLIHPLEYGMYRERCAKELLSFICDRSMAISDGFMISSENHVSTQCDIIMYQRDTMPIIDNGITNFFPVEIVGCIGEVKSTLKMGDFQNALIKMANNKKMFLERKGGQAPQMAFKEKDEIISFLICNNLGFDINEVDFDNIYREIEDVRFRHNMILSLQDGLLLYKFDAEKAPKIMKETFCKAFEENQVAWYFPHSTVGDQVYKCESLVVEVDTEDVYNHIIHFLNGLKNAMFGQREYKIDIGSYLMDDAIKQRCR